MQGEPVIHQPVDAADVSAFVVTLAGCAVAASVSTCPGRDRCEDALLLLPVDERRAVLAVADGFGGQPSGDRAARASVEHLADEILAVTRAGGSLQSGIMQGFDRANEAVLGWSLGAASTLVAVELDGTDARTYHVGDSQALLVGQRGRVKHRTMPHSPVGYGVESGLLDPDDAMDDRERHLVSNMVGSREMRIEVGPQTSLARYDTLLLASDGLFDNLRESEVIPVIRKGDLRHALESLCTAAGERMSGEAAEPSKPDDLAMCLLRLHR